MQGTIALDIDGTLTHDTLAMPERTAAYLQTLAEAGWRIVFITGRTFSSGYEALKALPFAFYFAVQNGAIILEMPKRTVISKKYLTREIFQEMNAICEGHPSDFVIYSGIENNDHCYFRPKRFASSVLDYLEKRIISYSETWHPLDSYEEMMLDSFPSIKCFGLYPSAQQLAQRIEERLGLHVPLIRDPFSLDYYVVQATHPQISKGQALQDLISRIGERGKVIAAGDDYNDLSMLAIADVKVVMATAPKEVLAQADVVAPAAAEEGIIVGLEAAIKHAGSHRF